MAKIESTKMTVSLDSDSKRLLRNLTKAIDRLSRKQDSGVGYEGIKRLTEPAEDIEDELLSSDSPVDC